MYCIKFGIGPTYKMLNHLLLLTCCKYSRFESYLFSLKGEIYDELFITFLGCTLSFMFLSIKWYVITMITVTTCSYTPILFWEQIQKKNPIWNKIRGSLFSFYKQCHTKSQSEFFLKID